VNVIDDPQERSGVFNQKRLITPLKQMPALAPETIEPRRIRALHPVHTINQIRLRRFERQMKVVSHKHVRMQHPPEYLTRLSQNLLK
jgi:hypothetical protein